MAKIVRSNLKKILDERGISIRSFSKMSGIPFEPTRKYYNNHTIQFHRETLAKICEVLEIELNELLEIVDKDEVDN